MSENATIEHGGEISLEQAETQARDIMANPQNPFHERWKKGDKGALDEVDKIYRKAVGNKPVEIGGGLLASSTPPLDLTKFSSNSGDPPAEADAITLQSDPEAFLKQQDEQEMAQLKEEWSKNGLSFEQVTASVAPLAQALYKADPDLFNLIELRLGAGPSLRVLKLIADRVTLTA